jgi:RNA polymerase sigma-70 factor (ECF subfamily)
VTRIAVRLALRQASRRKSVAWLDPFAAEAEVPAAVDGVRLGTTEAPDPALWALRAERDTELRRAVANLGEPYREVVALRFFGELTLQEIAASTSRPLGTVKTHLHRGLARLRADLEAEPR